MTRALDLCSVVVVRPCKWSSTRNEMITCSSFCEQEDVNKSSCFNFFPFIFIITVPECSVAASGENTRRDGGEEDAGG